MKSSIGISMICATKRHLLVLLLLSGIPMLASAQAQPGKEAEAVFHNVLDALSSEIVMLADDTQLLFGRWQVGPASGAATTTLRLNMVVVSRGGEWKIAQFRNSALP